MHFPTYCSSSLSMENLQDNMEHAYEHAPEFFGHVAMLYIVRHLRTVDARQDDVRSRTAKSTVIR